MMNIAHLVVMMVDSTSETWYELVNDALGEYGVLYRSKIHAALGEISHMRHLGRLPPLGHTAVNLIGRVVGRAHHGTQDPTQTAKQRPRDPPGPWGARGR